MRTSAMTVAISPARSSEIPRGFTRSLAKGQVMQQIVDSMNALGTQHVRQAGPNALDVLYGSGRLQHSTTRHLNGNVSKDRRLALGTWWEQTFCPLFACPQC